MAINRDKVEAAAIKLLQQGKYDKAIIEFKKLVDDDKTDVRNLLKLGETYVKVGAKKDSIDAYERAAAIYTEQGFYLKAVAVFKQILRVDANVPELHLKLAELYQQLGLTSDALNHYQMVAVFYEQQQRPREALDMLKRMVDLDPDNIASRIKLGELFAQQQMAAEAVQELRSALSFLKQQQRFDDFVRVGEKLVAYDQGALDVAEDLARIYMQRQQPSIALGKLQMCFKADPRNVEVLSMIAQAFLDMQQTAKTISVFKEMAKIYAADGNGDLATNTWERVLELVPEDVEAQTALGRISPQVTRPTHAATSGSGRPLAPTVVAPAQAQAAMAAAQTAAAAARTNPEDEQLQRLLTETDVYVKYGLKEKAIEHLQRVFSVRADHIPALEKLKTLQQQVGPAARIELVDTLRRLVRAAEDQEHIRADEWRGELERASAAIAGGSGGRPPRPSTQPSVSAFSSQSQPRGAPQSGSASGEGDFIIDDGPNGAALLDEPLVPPGSASAAAAAQHDESGIIALDDNASGIISLDPSAPDEDFLSGDGSMMDDISGTAVLPPDELAEGELPELTPQPLQRNLGSGSGGGAPAIPRMPTGVMNAPPVQAAPAPQRPEPMKAPPPAAFPPSSPSSPLSASLQQPAAPVFAPPAQQPQSSRSLPPTRPPLPVDDVVDLNDADALVRKALQDISAEDVAAAADELLLEASPDDVLPSSGEGDPMADFTGSTGPHQPIATTSQPKTATAATRSAAFASSPDEDEIDRLAREAVADANESLGAHERGDIEATALLSIDPGDLDDIREFEGDSGGFAAPAPSPPSSARAGRPLPPEMRAGDDDDAGGFDDPTLALLPPSFSSDMPTDERPKRSTAAAPERRHTAPSLLANRPSSDDEPAPSFGGGDDMASATSPSVRSAAASASKPGSAPVASSAAAHKPAPQAAPAPVVDGDLSDEFDPSSFDLPADVKELLRKDASAPSLDDEEPLDLDAELEAAGLRSIDSPTAATLTTTTSFKPAPVSAVGNMSGVGNGAAAGKNGAPSLPSLPPMPSMPELPPEMDLGDDFAEASSGDITLRGKLGLESKAQGFEDDPANQFFPDELEEAEFFIQQELLDEAKDILTNILEDVPDSARVQWMLARVTAKENGEPEPPAPWEQRILEEVQAQLEDLGIADVTGQRNAAEPPLGDGTAQISVEEVLSQFKKGVAETVPEDDAATHYELGIAYKEMGLSDDAVTEFLIAARAPSRAADARYMVGVVRLEQGQPEQALSAFEDAVSVATASKEQRGAAEYQRGLVLEQLARGPEALRAFKAAKAHGNNAPDIERRIKALIEKFGDVDVSGNGAAGAGKKNDKPGRGPKNIDYV